MGRTVGVATYDALAKPLGVVVLALMALCPLLARRQTEGAELSRTLILPTVTMLLSAPLWWYLGFQSNLMGLLGLLVCGFAFGAVIQFVSRTARRAAGPGKSLWSGLGRAVTRRRSRTAAYLVHLGMVFVVAGLLGSTVYKQESFGYVSTQAGTGEAVFVTDDLKYFLEFTGMRELPGSQGSTRYLAGFDVLEDGSTRLGVVEPHTDIYPLSGAVVRAVTLGRVFEDVFVVADEPFDVASDTIALRVVVFPLIRWVWIGSILLCAGAAVSLWPKRGTAKQEARETDEGGNGPPAGGADFQVARTDDAAV
jgi:cytochrome c-type biogenesis protein CcmF